MSKVRLFLKGYIEKSPDNFVSNMKSVVIESEEIFNYLAEGYVIMGSEKVENENQDNKQ